MKRTIKHRKTGKTFTGELPRGFSRSVSKTIDAFERAKEITFAHPGNVVEGIDAILTADEVKSAGYDPDGTATDKAVLTGKDAAKELRELFGRVASGKKTGKKTGKSESGAAELANAGATDNS